MTLPQDVTRLQSDMRAAVRQHWKAFLIEGILLVILGLAAMIAPPLAGLAVTIFLGWMFLISGIAGLALTFWARPMPGFWWSLVSAILAIGAGVILLAKPVQGVLTVTIVVGAYFLAEGVATIMYALEHRRELSERWSWMLFAGVLDILIAAMIIAGLPGSAEWAIGLWSASICCSAAPRWSAWRSPRAMPDRCSPVQQPRQMLLIFLSSAAFSLFRGSFGSPKDFSEGT